MGRLLWGDCYEKTFMRRLLWETYGDAVTGRLMGDLGGTIMWRLSWGDLWEGCYGETVMRDFYGRLLWGDCYGKLMGRLLLETFNGRIYWETYG